MRTELGDWNNGWFGLQLGLNPSEIDVLIQRLQMLKADPEQHFHLTSTYRGVGGVGDVTVYIQAPSEPDNMETIGDTAMAPGEAVPAPET